MLETGRLFTAKDSLRRSFQRAGPSRGATLATATAFLIAALLAIGVSLYETQGERLASENALRELLAIEPAAPPPAASPPAALPPGGH